MRHLAPNDPRIGERSCDGDLSSRPGARSPEIGSRAEAVSATLLESLECGILVFGPGGDLWAVNDRFAEILGVEPARLRELGNLEQIVDIVASQWRTAIATQRACGSGFGVERPFVVNNP